MRRRVPPPHATPPRRSPPRGDRRRPSVTPASSGRRAGRCAGDAGRGDRGVGQDHLRGVLARGGRAEPGVGVGEPRRSRRRPARLLVRRRDRADARPAGTGGRDVATGRRGRRRGGRPAAGDGVRAPPRARSDRPRPRQLARDPVAPGAQQPDTARPAATAEPGAARHDAPGPTLAAGPTPPRRAGGGSAGGRPRLPRRGGRRLCSSSWASA